MTHPLSEELRKLADKEFPFFAYTDALRRAADALDKEVECPGVTTAMRFFNVETARLEAEQRAERAEAEAQRYRVALEKIVSMSYGEECSIAETALRKLETGGET